VSKRSHFGKQDFFSERGVGTEERFSKPVGKKSCSRDLKGGKEGFRERGEKVRGSVFDSPVEGRQGGSLLEKDKRFEKRSEGRGGFRLA